MRLNRSGRALLFAVLTSPALASAQEAKPTPPGEAPPPSSGVQPPRAPQPPPGPPVEPAKPPTFTIALHGFVGGTLFAQDAVTRVSEGGLAMWVSPQGLGAGTIGGAQPKVDKLIFNGDVRQTRFNFSVAGPPLVGATPRGVLEIDFYNGFGSGNFGGISLTPRMRLAYAELDWAGNQRLLIGQQNDLTIAFVSYALSHLANPLSFVSGLTGWRRPGVFGYHTIAGDKKREYVEFAWEVGAPYWAVGNTIGAQNATTGNPGADRFGFQSGEASGLPAVEARIMVGQGANDLIYATGHWNKVDRSGADALPSPAASDLDVVGLQLGAKGTLGPLTLQSQAFTGKNLAPLTGAFLQFQGNQVGDVHEYGGYLQAGFNFTPVWSLWGMLGTDKVSDKDARAANRAIGTYGVVQNVVSQGFVQYRNTGYALSLEWTHWHTRTLGTTRALDANLDANQWAFSGIYFF